MNQKKNKYFVLKSIFVFAYSFVVLTLVFNENSTLMLPKNLAANLDMAKDETPLPVPKAPNNMSRLPMNDHLLASLKNDGVLSSEARLNHLYVRKGLGPFVQNQPDFAPLDWQPTDEAFYYLDNQGHLLATESDGQHLWTFELPATAGNFTSPPVAAGLFLYLYTEKGNIYCLKRATGRVQWYLPLNRSLIGRPVLVNQELIVTERDSAAEYYLLKIDPLTGQLIERSERLALEILSPWFTEPESKVLVARTKDNQLIGVDRSTMKIKWSYQSKAQITAAPSMSNGRVFSVTESGEAMGFKANSGELLWTYQLKGPTRNPMTYVPSFNFVTVLTNSGYLHAIHSETGAGQWRFNTRNNHQHGAALAVALNRRSMTKLNLTDEHQGWTVWAPCAEERICIFNPATGQLVWRVRLRGQLLSNLFYNGRNQTLHAILQDSNPGADPALGPQMAEFAEYLATPKKSSPQSAVDNPNEAQ